MNNLIFSPGAWDEYLYFQMQDKKTLKRINALLRDTVREPLGGIGKPEVLKYRKNCISRRIDSKNRLVYEISDDGDILIISCRGHYDDN